MVKTASVFNHLLHFAEIYGDWKIYAHMKAPNISYSRMETLSEALQALGGHSNAVALAGGQSLLPMLNLRLARPELLIDISRIPEISRLHEDSASWVVGSAVTHAQIEDSRHMFRACPLVADVAAGIAYRSVRNLGTIGGSLAHADPAADWPVVLAALDAKIRIVGGKDGTRIASVAGFIKGPFTTLLEPGELIEAIEIPKPPPGTRLGYYKFCRKAGDFPEANAAVVLFPDHEKSQVCIGALSGPPLMLSKSIFEFLKSGGATLNEPEVVAAVRSAAPNLDPIDVSIHAAAVVRAVQRALLS
jgi:carbon-monoxide dehydrogenase medium subunit